MEKINFQDSPSQETPLSAHVLNLMQDNIEADINTTKAHKYTTILTADTGVGGEITLPCSYKVGTNCLDIYCNGERLILSSDNIGTDGHYYEIGEINSISSKIKCTTDWNWKSGDIVECVVRGGI